MKIKDAIKYLSEYENQEEQLMISWNDKETMNWFVDGEVSDELWNKAVSIYEDASVEGFSEDSRWAMQEAQKKESAGA